jgi:MbtH protein
MDPFDEGELHVVVNDEEQYSIWPARLAVPSGWRTVGEPADRERCLATIEALWTDIRPRSLRRALQDGGAA